MGGWAPSLDKTPQFIRIDDPDRVMEIINKLSGSAKKHAG
jgi:hypothetical protein